MASEGLLSLSGVEENEPFYPQNSQEQEQSTSHMLWSQNAHYSPYSLSSCTQSSARSWNHTEQTQPAGETDMQRSDERDSLYDYSYGCLLTSSSIWSPLGEEKLQDLQADAKTQQYSSFLPNQDSAQTRGQPVAKNMNNSHQGCSDTSAKQLQAFNGYKPQSLAPPPNLPLPNKGGGFLPQTQWNTYSSTTALENTGSIQHLNKIPVMSEVFLPPDEMTGASFEAHCDEPHIQNSTEPLRYETRSPQCINRLVNSFQSLMAADYGHLLQGEIPLLNRGKVGLYKEEKVNHLTTSTHTPSITHISREMGGYGKIHMEKNRVVRSKMSKCSFGSNANLPNQQSFQQAHFYSGTLQNRQQKIPVATKSALLPVNVKGNHHYRNHAQQGHSRNKPQPAKEKKRTHASGFQGEGYSTRSVSNFHQKVAESKRFPPPNSLHTPTFYCDSGRGESLQLDPPVFKATDHAGQAAINFSSIIPRFRTPRGSSLTGLETCNVEVANEIADFGPVFSDTVNNQATGNLSAAAKTTAVNEAPVKQVQLYMEECHNHWRLLEMELEMAEAVLGKTPSRKDTSSSSSSVAKSPSEQPNVEELLVHLTEAQEKVAGLLDNIEGLSVSLHINIHTALKRHHMAISMTQARRKEGITNMMRRHQLTAPRTECRDTLLLAIALKDLAASTRKLRTALWCALQMALPKPVHRLDEMEEREAVTACPLPTMNTYFTL